MGCDIHLYVERRVEGVWTPADMWKPSKHAEDEGRLSLDYQDAFYHDRNYDLFAILADVRNGHGVAGVTTGLGFVPIAEPKGLPDDVSDVLKAESDYWDSDGHSHSWHTVADLMAYDWTQTTTHVAEIGGYDFWRWEQWSRRQGESPESYAGSISGASIEHISEDEMRAIITQATDGLERDAWESAVRRSTARKVTRIQWEQPYYKCCRRFLSDTLPRLWRLGAPEDVRIVFWFDN